MQRSARGTRAPRSRWLPPAGETRDVGLHVRVSGAGPRTFLLLHGLGGSHRYFGAQFDVLAEEGRLVVPDLLGFGRSPRPADGTYGPGEHAEAVIAALESVAAQGPLWIGTHSVGTLIALRLARLRPDWVRGIVAFGPPLYRTREEARVHLSRLGLWVRLFAMETPWARWACGWMCRHRELAARLAQWMRPDLPPEIARDAVQHSWLSYSGSFRNLVMAAQEARDIAAVQATVELIAGDRDTVVDAGFLRELAGTYGHVRLELWPGGHDLPLSSPERCAERLRSLGQDPGGVVGTAMGSSPPA